MKNKDVIVDFVHHTSSKVLNLYSDGNKLFSFETCIAQWNNGVLIINCTKYSITTSRHLTLLRRALLNDVCIIEVKDIPIETKDLEKFIINYNN